MPNLAAEWALGYRYRPVEFAHRTIPFGKPGPWESWSGLHDWQAEFFRGIAQEQYQKEWGPDPDGKVTRREPINRAICSGAGTGKTAFVLPFLVLWQMAVWPRLRVLAMSTTETQLKDRFFNSGIVVILENSPELRRLFAWQSLKVWRRDSPDSTATFRTGDNPGAILGAHSHGGQMLIPMDECAWQDDEMWEATGSARQDPQTITVLCGNPWRNEGFFFDRHSGRLADRWKTVFVDAREQPGWTQDQEEDLLAEHGGEDTDAYRALVMGRPPLAGSRSFIRREQVERSMDLPLIDTAGKSVVPEDFPLVAGLDLAGFGAASTCLAFTAGVDGRTIPPVSIQGVSAREKVDWLLANVEREYPPYGKPVVVFYDITGSYGDLEELLRLYGYGKLLRPVNFGAKDPQGRFESMRGALWNGFRRWLDRGGRLPRDPDLLRLITAAEDTANPRTGKRKITEKEELARRAGRTKLDELDARMLSCLSAPRRDRPERGGAGPAAVKRTSWAG